ncbi:uncharacterized protein EV154DRAFT_563449 [Mucor mucedo]|uniref:uncharacterized protein n=1 Tax=Mucor mucedo TaxID=29922 RepID=UPI00221F5FA7|nr:uncharacterized protein EV154DRAFT_563449 [Mucor mucedo]KAI7891322.1 hypothetical protein EV154DRAFT_563449 [Mucor mucedo]
MSMKRKLAEHECYYYLDTDEQVLPQPTEQEKRVKFMQLFQKMYQHMEQDTAFCITTDYRSNARRVALREKRLDYKKKLKKVGLSEIPMEKRWSIEDEHELEQIADATRRAFIFASVKQINSHPFLDDVLFF